ncbi:Translation protein, beta-barrel domain containing protein [Parasponia andersonii]|uniref:Translation protein, beta-barrel domain containing protein n=1 Tax=Parasponia andersonii TaxID=3476 RepID=A0A2P5DUX5_PARAD|nr:Translation protein, beta-barrel domain containing protein [Parasponia andersonii]
MAELMGISWNDRNLSLVGTLICIPQKDFIDIDRIVLIENNHEPIDIAKNGQKVAIKYGGKKIYAQRR